ncbi:universal stress protein [Roseateles cellulosilyticus]|uniref:Universal stress protein n=1 Tax=Pelomonas cellulosilytica TaxID=2906762 RepID=A0ABS8XY67_9BURK|nr:universal stress protein [Pelomonas sp. P8]MCE4556747.1 universal stress protein [Pelomonas sp. P8]
MGYPSILVHLDNGRTTPGRIATAVCLAERFDAHLTGLAPTGWASIPPDVGGALGLAAYQEATMDALREQADDCVRHFLEQASGGNLRSYEGRADVGFAEEVMTLAARYCDLTVVTQPDPDLAQSPRIAEELLLRSGRPLLVLPYAGDAALPPAPRVLVGWNGSREAARALHDALPLLRAATSVQVAVFEAPDDIDSPHGDLPGADIGLWLARHRVKVDVNFVPVAVSAGEALLSHAADASADLIVAGGYGHSRFREAVLGGVTRTLLRSSPVPVLLSH